MLKLDLDVDMFTIYAIIVLFLIMMLYILVDVNYFLRAGATILYGTYFQSTMRVDEEVEMPGFCTTQDMDFLLSHMNNARYIREADFGRFHFFARTRMLTEIRNTNGHILQGALSMRYRKPIPIFSSYVLKTKVLFWDDKNIYFEQQFCSSDGFVKAIMLSQNKIININIPEIMSRLLKKDESYRPEVPAELKLWIDSIEASSMRLRKKE